MSQHRSGLVHQSLPEHLLFLLLPLVLEQLSQHHSGLVHQSLPEHLLFLLLPLDLVLLSLLR